MGGKVSSIVSVPGGFFTTYFNHLFSCKCKCNHKIIEKRFKLYNVIVVAVAWGVWSNFKKLNSNVIPTVH